MLINAVSEATEALRSPSVPGTQAAPASYGENDSRTVRGIGSVVGEVDAERVAAVDHMVVRSSVIDTAAWDQQSKQQQEQTIGRFKFSGTSLDLADDPAQTTTDPLFATEPGNETVPLTSHVRKATPRPGPDDLARRLFRRGYLLIDAELTVVKHGLVFIAFARTITTQFEFIQRAWMSNPDFPRPGTGVDAFKRFESVTLRRILLRLPNLEHTKPWDWQLPPH